MLGQAGLITTFSFGREQESSADSEAMDTLQHYYQHLDGAAALFEILIKEESSLSPPAFLRTHPLTRDRIERIGLRAAKIQRSENVKLVPLPQIINRSALKSQSKS